VLYVSHNMNTIRRLCERCVVLDKGKIIYNGDVEKAIEVYLGKNTKFPPVVDLRNIQRTQQHAEGIQLTSMEVLDRADWTVNAGEKLRFIIRAKATEELRHVGFRARLHCVDGTSVSVLLARDLICCVADEEIEIPLEADISQLVPGTYYLTPSLYGVNEYGAWHFYDHIEQAVAFEVKTVVGFNENMPWDQKWWGNIKLPELMDLRK